MKKSDYSPYPSRKEVMETETPFDLRLLGSVRAPNAWAPGGGVVSVRPGDIITWDWEHVDGHFATSVGRVLSLAMRGGDGRPFPHPFLYVIEASADLHYGYGRLVDPEDVKSARSAGGVFASWFFSAPATPDPAEVYRVERYGALNDQYLAQHLDREGHPKLHGNDPKWHAQQERYKESDRNENPIPHSYMPFARLERPVQQRRPLPPTNERGRFMENDRFRKVRTTKRDH